MGRVVTRPDRTRRALVGGGALVMAYAVTGVLGDPDARPLGILIFLAGVLIAHDAVLLPVVIALGALVDRWVPPVVRPAVRFAGVVTVAVLVVAVPLVLGRGRRADDPSALPLHYGRGLAVVLAVLWASALALPLVSHAARRWWNSTRRRRPAD